MSNKQLMKTLNTVLSKVGNANTNKSGKNTSKRRRRRRTNAIQERVPRGILAGYGSAITSSFYTSHSGDGCMVRGIDLVSSDYSFTTQTYHYISYFVTANPATWAGTRIAAVAQGFQNYRPLSFKIHYRPQTGSTSSVSMFLGTVWQDNYIRYPASLEPSLVTSPGGTYLPAWQSSTSVVPLGNKLPQRMYPIRDPTMSTVPFSVVARASDGDGVSNSVTMPGRIFIEYSYRFDNAVGYGGTANNGPGANGFAPGAVTWGTVYASGVAANSMPAAGWIVDKSIISTSTEHTRIPFFCHLSWDRGSFDSSTSNYQWYSEINGADVQGMSTNSVPVAIYTDDGAPA